MQPIKPLIAIALIVLCTTACHREPIDYVDPLIGTGFHGHTFPGATTPFGSVQLSPDTRANNWDACAGYHHSDSTINGFSHTHLSGTGCADLGDLLFHPTTRAVDTTRQGYIFEPYRFSHADETASAGYYSVRLRDEGLTVELTATPRTGVHRYTFERGSKPRVVVDLLHAISEERLDEATVTQTAANELCGVRRTTGWVANQRVYFAARFSRPFAGVEIIRNGAVAIAEFEGDAPLEVKVGISTVSVENARENLICEVGDLDFDQVHLKARESWRQALDQITVTGGTEREKRIFYTALYHTQIAPNVTSDYNGQFRRNDQTIGHLPKGQSAFYSTLSLWDTFRAWLPLMSLVNTPLIEEISKSMLDIYDATGELPIWPLSSGETDCMIGYHAIPFITEAYLHGAAGFDAKHAFEAMKRSSEINKKGSEYYLRLGYIPADIKRESVSCLLEYAYDDWCIAQMAKALGYDKEYDEYTRRATNYVNVFDGKTRFFRGKRLDGGWNAPLAEFVAGRDYTEATPWQYRFFTPHDVNGLVQLFGGSELFGAALDTLFTRRTPEGIEIDLNDITGMVGQYSHGNEPSHHMAYLYNYIGEPWKTQAATRRLIDEMYDATPDGIVGNEDCGQMSAWYILSSLGLYAVCPVSGEFSLTTPLFEKATIRLANGKQLTITANSPGRNRYIDQVTLNGVEISTNYVTYEQLMQGGTLAFTLSSKPNRQRGATAEAAPYSQSRGRSVSPPYTSVDVNLFLDSIRVDLDCATPDAQIHYTLDGSEPTAQSTPYDRPFTLTRSLPIKAKAFKEGYAPSRTTTLNALRATLAPAVTPRGTMQHGTRFSYRRGTFSSVEELTAAAEMQRGTMESPSIASAADSDHFGYLFEGLIFIPQSGVWGFTTKSDDGSVLYIDGRKVVDNDGSHAAVTAEGRIALQRGYHRYRLLYFEDYEGEALNWGWIAPGDNRESPIPADALFLDNN